MAAAGAHLRFEDHFLCSICLDVFTDPVSTPCGHNFCNKCITKYWDTSFELYCPLCKEVFYTRPQLKINTMFSQLMAQVRREAQEKTNGSPEQRVSENAGNGFCDACTGTKVKAVKSCLECLTSYCETHLETHLTAPRLKRHQLIEPVDDLEDWICPKHSKPLELFCKTDETCVCSLCPVLDHKGHEFVPLKEGYEEKKVALNREVQQMIQERQVEIEEIRHLMKMSQDDADTEKAEGVEVFAAMKEAVDRGLHQFLKDIEDKQTAAEKQAKDLITELEEKISELMKRSTDLEHLSLSGDHIHLLQSFSFLKAAPPTKDWTEVRVCPPLYGGAVVRAMEKVEEMLHKQMGKLKKLELKKIQQFAVDLTLDPDTAHPKLILSEDGKQVHCGDVKKKLPENPHRFSHWVSVLAKQRFSSGRIYFEVQVKGKTKWDLGVVRESIIKKGFTLPCPQNGFWTIRLRNRNEYEAGTDPSVCLSVSSPPEKVGVFVDYDEGLVSFYDADAADLIFSFTGCSFTDKLRPYFNPCYNDGGKNSAPQIICPVSKTV